MTQRAWRVYCAITCALALALGLTWGLGRAQAGPSISAFYVTSTEDGAANPTNCPSLTNCRLRDALAASDPGDFIFFNLPDDSLIVLTEGELVVDHSLTIIGATSRNVAVSGDNATRVFAVTAPLTVVSLTIEYGSADSDGGGLATDSPVTLHRVAFLANTAANHGGGLYAGSTAELSGTTFISNTSTFGNGGGAFVVDSANVKGGTFERNTAQRMFAADYGLGGGLITLGPLDLAGTSFLSNTAGNSGGGIRSNSTSTLANVSFIANTARFLGAGMLSSGPLAVSHAQFLANVAGSDGGGLSALGSATLTDTQFLANTAGDGGGAFFARAAALNGAEFYGNTCPYGGCTNGGVFGYSAHSTLALSQSVTTGDDFDVWGDWVNDGTFVQTAGTTTFDTYFPLSVTGGGSTTFHHVRINPAQGISLFANINLSGDFTNTGRLTPAGGSVTFNGSAMQRITGSADTTFGDLAIANTGPGVWLGQDITVSNRLTLTSDLSTTTNYTLFLTANAASVGPGDVWGRTARRHPFSLATTYAFGSPFVSLNFTGGMPPSAIALDLTRTPPANAGNTVRRGYAIEALGGGYVARLRLHYRDGELNGNAEGTLQLWRNAGSGPWTPYPTSGLDTTDNWVESNAVSALSWWAISQFAPRSRLYLPLIKR